MTTPGFTLRRLLFSLAGGSLLLLASASSVAQASTPTASGTVVPLWKSGAPGFETRKDEPEQAKDWWVKNIHNPSLTVFLPPADKATGTAVIIAPGGGFRELVFDAEGTQAAEFLNNLGVAAFVLKYRLPNTEGSPYSMDHVKQDAHRAVRAVRHRAVEWGVNPDTIGMLGFSAGGALINLVAYSPGQGYAEASDPIDRVDGKPNFQILIYPGGDVPESLPADSPPAFLLVATDDEYGCDETTLKLYQRLRAAKVSVEAHFLARGKHAFNMGDRSSFASVNTWPVRMADWLRDSGYLKTKN